jgi:hypothetical protein
MAPNGSMQLRLSKGELSLGTVTPLAFQYRCQLPVSAGCPASFGCRSTRLASSGLVTLAISCLPRDKSRAYANPDAPLREQPAKMSKSVNRGLPIGRLLMVVSSLAPLFLLWAIRGSLLVADRYWVPICLGLAVLPNLALLGRWRIASHRNDHRMIIVAGARDQSEHLLVYLFAMLLPLFAEKPAGGRELFAVAAAFAFIVILFWHMNLHYMNIVFAVLGYRVYTIEVRGGSGTQLTSVVLLSRRHGLPLVGASIDTLRLSDTVYVEKEAANAGRV